MKVYIVCRSWVNGYEDHGWAIVGTFLSEQAASDFMFAESIKKEYEMYYDCQDWWYEELTVNEE